MASPWILLIPPNPSVTLWHSILPTIKPSIKRIRTKPTKLMVIHRHKPTNRATNSRSMNPTISPPGAT
jgi:hypothetical protein